MLKSIVYVSTSVMDMSGPALEDLLVEARDLNALSGVTGVLLCSDLNFMQCIEGEDVSFDEAWARIRDSRRHKGIVTLMDEPIAQRAFGDWQMGFRRFEPGGLLALSTARWECLADTERRHAPVGLALLQDFWRNNR